MSGMKNYESLDALAMAQGVREGAFLPRDLLEAAIERAEAQADLDSRNHTLPQSLQPVAEPKRAK